MDIFKKYDSLLKEHSTGAKAVGWKSEEGQQIRLKTLLSIVRREDDTILDYGCGLGAMYKYLQDDYWASVEFGKCTGYDINPNMVIEAQRQHPHGVFKCILIPGEESYDFVLASGIFCFDQTLETVEKELRKMFSFCNKAVGANFLNAHSKQDGESSYFYPNDILKIAEKISKKIVLRSDYKDNDFTIFIYK